VARITVEDCLSQIPNRFLMTVAAILRARQIMAGDPVRAAHAKNHKPVLAALREIASGLVKVKFGEKQGDKDSSISDVSKVLELVLRGR